ncbi:ABC transporter permease subunit [Frankia sp. CNm7]|uniref:ABC transporter permease subunit n=1 Tax=Frankia nepalensis TaxID=1836974 RepID=A0A937RU65_9ACTN|nr:ABC transporter permease subunit [Frankia nepalensis]MBL7500976.1 ABC transporter permease subunit [Frankia nepalensis]MBL7512428.1 ABC transporter permease subunit [Frankia nepalensis]MBL7517001.1 ABC transporter permease subunit [Frankia nepalensis]MBL7631961.1 ABC transporter permease subunit [Frankia nepalensis]
MVRAGLPPAAVFAAVVGIWYAVTYWALAPRRRFLLPPPHQVVSEGFLDQRTLADILTALWGTTKVALVGLAIAAALGLLSAVLMAQATWIEHSFYPWAILLQTIPVLAIVPLIGFWLGYGFWSRTVVCVIIAMFPMITSTLFGIQSVDSRYHDLFTLRRVGRWRRLVRLELPNALPAIFAGLRISAGLSVIGAIVGDFFFRRGDVGIGALIDNYTRDLSSGPLFAAIIASALLGLMVFWAFGLAAKLAVGPWHESVRRRRR